MLLYGINDDQNRCQHSNKGVRCLTTQANPLTFLRQGKTSAYNHPAVVDLKFFPEENLIDGRVLYSPLCCSSPWAQVQATSGSHVLFFVAFLRSPLVLGRGWHQRDNVLLILFCLPALAHVLEYTAFAEVAFVRPTIRINSLQLLSQVSGAWPHRRVLLFLWRFLWREGFGNDARLAN